MLRFPMWKIISIMAIGVMGIVMALPNILDPKTVSNFPHWLQPVRLGLDLQGGSHLLLEVDTKAGLKDQLFSALDNIRSILRKQKAGYSDLVSSENTMSFKLRTATKSDDILRVLKREMRDFEVTEDGNKVVLSLTDEAKGRKTDQMLKQSIEIVRKRVDEFGTSEPDIQQQGQDRILIQLPGINDPARLRQLLGRTAKLTYRMIHPNSAQLLKAGRIPPGFEKLDNLDDLDEHSYIVEKRVILSGENLEDATVNSDDRTNQPVVSITFDTNGARKFGQITTEKTGHQLGIILDNKVISAPVLTEPILGGKAQISGRFSMKDASDLAILMRSGSMPAPLKIIEERTVGPSLGADSINAGKNATLLAVGLVTGFMILAYSFFGIIANIALLINGIFLVALMSLFGTTLTLPGIAGIALTLGMAVDANVLIYERIKEELRDGRSNIQALEAGYQKAMATIIDSNLTTLIGSTALFIFGSGPIRGFAVTLSLGIIVSMFTAIVVTRLIIAQWFKFYRPTRLPI